MNLSTPVYIQLDYVCPFPVRVPYGLSLADFLGSLVTCAIGSSRRTLRTIVFQLRGWICLPSSLPTHFNVPFRRHAAVSLLRLHVTPYGSHGILTVSAIALAVRLRLRTRLTPGRLALPGKPWSFGGRESHPPSRYLYLHLLFHALRHESSSCVRRTWNAPLPILFNSIPCLRYLSYTRLLSMQGPSTSELLRTL